MPQHHYIAPGNYHIHVPSPSKIMNCFLRNHSNNIPNLLEILTGHEAFSSLVDVAVQQPLLPVPHKEEKRPNVPVSEHAPPTHHDMRYHHFGKFTRFIDEVRNGYFLLNL